MIESLINTWRGSSPRERRMVIAAALIVFLALVFLLLIEPAWRGRQALQRELPELRAQLASMSELSAEVRRLAGSAPAASSAGSLPMRASIEKSLKLAGLDSSLQRITPAGELLELRFGMVDHARWLDWLNAALRDTRARVVDLSISRESAPGMVSVRLVLEPPRRGAG